MLMLISIFFPILSGLALLLSKTENRSLRERWVIGSAVVTAVLGIAAVLTGYGEPLTLVRFAENVELGSEERRVGKECRSRWSPYH